MEKSEISNEISLNKAQNSMKVDERYGDETSRESKSNDNESIIRFKIFESCECTMNDVDGEEEEGDCVDDLIKTNMVFNIGMAEWREKEVDGEIDDDDDDCLINNSKLSLIWSKKKDEIEEIRKRNELDKKDKDDDDSDDDELILLKMEQRSSNNLM